MLDMTQNERRGLCVSVEVIHIVISHLHSLVSIATLLELLLELIGLEGGQGCAAEVLYYLLVRADGVEHLMLFQNMRIVFESHFPLVYRLVVSLDIVCHDHPLCLRKH